MKKALLFALVLILCLPLLCESKKYVRVAVEMARIRDIPSLEGKIVARVEKGTELEIIEQIGEWFRVYLPDKKGTGYISGRVVVVISKEVKEERPKEVKKEVRVKREVTGKERIEKPLSFFLTMSFDSPFANFEDNYIITAYQEEGNYSGKYNASNGFCPEIGIAYRLKEKIGLTFSIEPLISKTNGDILVKIPHPFYYGNLRNLEIKDKYSYTEIPFNFNVIYEVGNFKGISFSLTGGLTLFYSSVEILDKFTYSETYPYDTVNLTSTKNKSFSSFSPGFNAGLLGSYPIKESLLTGIQIKGSFGRGSFKPEGRDKVSYTLGGVRAGLFVKFVF